MNQMGMVADAERLPWLTDEKPRRGGHGILLAVLGTLAVFAVAGGSYWAGMQTAPDADVTSPSTTIELPEPVVGKPEVIPTEPSVEDAQPKPLATPEAEPQRAAPVIERKTSARPKPRATVKKRAAPAAPKKAVLRPWPVRDVEGASGRMVRIGAFASARQAKRGWWKVVGTYPGMKRIPALVVPVQSLRNGQTYYRLQMGTTSQAHSEVLCQRMRIIGQSCIVIGLPKAP
jgi:hypothetical protein